MQKPTFEKNGLGLVVTQNGLKQPHQRLRQHIREIILRVNRHIVLQHKDRILRLLIHRRALARRNNNIRHAVAQLRRVAGIPLLHLVRQLHVGLLRRVLLVRFRQLLRAGLRIRIQSIK